MRVETMNCVVLWIRRAHPRTRKFSVTQLFVLAHRDFYKKDDADKVARDLRVCQKLWQVPFYVERYIRKTVYKTFRASWG